MFADLTGKVVIVTGTGSGIGRATALACARQGASVVGCDYNADTAAETVALLEAEGLAMHSVHPVDLTKPEDARSVVAEAIRVHGGIDVLANVAAVTASFVPFAQADFESHWHFTLKGELDLLFLLTQAAWPHLIARGGGSIVNVASATAHMGYEHMPALPHITAKGGVIAMTRQLAAEGAVSGIRVNSVSPSLIETPASAEALNAPGAREHLMRNLLIKRYGRPEDVASCIVFLASDESSWVTGSDYMVDGGTTII